MDARIDDAGPGKVDRTRQAIEQSGMVGGIDRDERSAAQGIDFGADRQLLVTSIGDVVRVANEDIVGLGDPVAFGEAFDIGVEARRIPIECGHQRPLFRGDLLAAPGLLVAKAQHFFGGFIQVTEQLPLPAVPHAGADCADIDDGQRKEEAQAFGRLHRFDEIHDRLVIRQVALERGCRHQQVPADEPRDGLGFGR